MYYNSENNTEWIYVKKVLENELREDSVKLLILGESRVNAGFDNSQIKNSWMFAPGGTTPVEIYYALKKFLSNHKKPDLIFFSVSPRFLTESFAFWQYAVRNDFFSFSEFKEINNNKTLLNDSIFGNCSWIKFLLYKSKYIGYYQNDFFTNRVFFGYKKNKQFIENLYSSHGQRFYPLNDSCSDLNYETRYKNFKPSPLLVFYLKKIAKICNDEKIKFIFEAMPMNESSFNKLNERFLNEYNEFIKQFAEEFPNHTINHQLYFYNDSYFGDASHLNLKGKKKFTDYIKTKYFNLMLSK